MCIQFVYINNCAGDGEYQLILLNQREEYYKRPAKPAHYWQADASHCIGGTDEQVGREGGTWFAISSQGKAGALLNILQDAHNPTAKMGRGFLVRDYLTSDVECKTYLDNIYQHKEHYSPFNLVLLYKKSSTWNLSYISTECEGGHDINQGFHAFSNSSPNTLFTKVKHGKTMFKKIIEDHPKTSNKQHLIEDLFKLMSSTDVHLPDAEMVRLGGRSLQGESLSQFASIHVFMPDISYGSRTTSLVLVDSAGHCDYIERTMREPITDHNNIIWDTTQHTFDII